MKLGDAGNIVEFINAFKKLCEQFNVRVLNMNDIEVIFGPNGDAGKTAKAVQRRLQRHGKRIPINYDFMRDVLARKNLTVSWLANEVGCSPSAIHSWKHKYEPLEEMVERIATVLDIESESLIGEEK